MNFRSIPAFIVASILLGVEPIPVCASAPQPSDVVSDFQQLLQKIGTSQADPCDPPNGKDPVTASTEGRIFSQTANIVEQELNADSNQQKPPLERATGALKKLERVSAEINAAWPEEKRFHFEILDLRPALVVKMSIRARAYFEVFGIPDESQGKPGQLWKQVGSNIESLGGDWPQTELVLYPLHRGPSKNARFLAEFNTIGCAGNAGGAAYEAYEWNPELNYSEIVIQQTGSYRLDDVPALKNPFPSIGVFRTEGPLISLPYCWFSAVDTWDNPSLCAVDTYDLSGNDVRFHSRRYNRPDLVPVAKAIEYAEKRDYPAVLGYSANANVARKMVREIPPSFASGELQVKRITADRERVEFGAAYRFEVEKRADQWLVIAFSTE